MTDPVAALQIENIIHRLQWCVETREGMDGTSGWSVRITPDEAELLLKALERIE